MSKEQQQDAGVDLFLGGDPDGDMVMEIPIADDADRGDSIEDTDPAALNDLDELQGLEKEEPAKEEEQEEEEEPAKEEPTKEDPAKEEEQEEEQEEDPAKEEPTKAEPENKIPLKRFNQVNEKRKAAELRAQAAEAELAALKNPENAAAKFDFDAKETEYLEAVADGELDKAKAIRTEIRAAEQAQYVAAAKAATADATNATKQSLEFDAVAEDLASRFDEFNIDSENFNQDLVDDIMDMQDYYVSKKGMSSGQALKKAAEYYAKEFELVDKSAAKPAADPEPKPKPEPKPTNIKEKAKVANSQPESPRRSDGISEDVYDIENMSDADYEALPAATKARLRGDIL